MNKKLTLQTGKLKPYLLLLVVLLMAYLPVSTFYFGMKNDAFSDNFPNKFFFSEAISSGFLPLWNPYLNFGFPIYADPGFAFWNPITWFFGAIVKYNAYTLTIEVLLYIYIAGVAMYRLGKYLAFTSTTAFAVAVMYMCCGFFTGELQHINFITAAAFLPFLLQQFLLLFQQPSLKNAGITAIAYYMVFAGGHPAIPIATMYFFFTLFVVLFALSSEYKKNWKSIFQSHLAAVVLFILLFSPALYSYASIIGEYGRGSAIDQNDVTAFNAGFSPVSYLSFLYPFATIKNANIFIDDLAMRNGYFSIAGFAFLLTQLTNKNHLIRALIICSLVMLVVSCGGIIKPLIYSTLPLLQYIKTNGEFRIFSILCFCVIAGHALNKLSNPSAYVVFKRTVTALLIVSLALLTYLIIKNGTNFFNLPSGEGGLTASVIKNVIDTLTFDDSLLISLLINSVFLFLLLLAKRNLKKIVSIIVLDLIVNATAYLPFTGIGKVTLAEIQETYNKSQPGIITPPTIAINNTDTLSAKRTGLVGSWSFYNKQIGITALTDYPSYFSNTGDYFQSDLPLKLNNFPYVFFQGDTTNFLTNSNYSSNALKVDSFSPQKMVIKVSLQKSDSLIFLQNYYRYWRAKANGKEIPISRSHISFMSVPLKKGVHSIEFYYQDKWMLLFVSLSMITLVVILLIIIIKNHKISHFVTVREESEK